MTVKIIETGEIQEVNDGYGVRLVEQGKAIPAAKPAVKPAPRRPSGKKE